MRNYYEFRRTGSLARSQQKLLARSRHTKRQMMPANIWLPLGLPNPEPQVPPPPPKGPQGQSGSNELFRQCQHILTGLKPAWLVPEVMSKPTKSIGKSSSSRKRKAPSSNDKNSTVRLPFLKRCCDTCWLSYHKSFSRQHKTSALHRANKQRWLRGLRPFRYFPIHPPYWPTSAHTIASRLEEVADLLPPIDRRR